MTGARHWSFFVKPKICTLPCGLAIVEAACVCCTKVVSKDAICEDVSVPFPTAALCLAVCPKEFGS